MIINEVIIQMLPFNAWCLLKGHKGFSVEGPPTPTLFGRLQSGMYFIRTGNEVATVEIIRIEEARKSFSKKNVLFILTQPH